MDPILRRDISVSPSHASLMNGMLIDHACHVISAHSEGGQPTWLEEAFAKAEAKAPLKNTETRTSSALLV